MEGKCSVGQYSSSTEPEDMRRERVKGNLIKLGFETMLRRVFEDFQVEEWCDGFTTLKKSLWQECGE